MPSAEQLQKAIAADPQDPFLHYALALELAKGAQGDAALAAYDRCLELDPAYCYAYYHKAKLLESLGRLADARQTLTAGLAKAREARDGKALNEISVYLDSIS